MNNTFNLQRFLWLFNKHTKEHFKTYLMSTIVLLGMLVFIMAYCGYLGFLGSGPQVGIFYTTLLLGGSIFTSTIFADINNKRKAISILTLPVSHFERFLVGWIYSFVILQIVFIACFYLVDCVMISLINNSSNIRHDVVNVFSKNQGERALLVVFFILHSMMIMGSLYFKKLHFVKTALVFFMLLVLYIATNNLLVHSILGADFHVTLPFGDVWIVGHDDKTYYLKTSGTVYTKIIFAAFVVSCCIWIAAYFKMKEKQV